ncbi:MAG TPA: dihydroorotase [Ktedonobacterales bacterium]|nr:dihydroorotase [Ktedonobacterales bacterium]
MTQQLALVGARIIDPGQKLDATGWLLIRDGRIVAHGTDADALAARAAESDAPLRTVELPASWVLAPGFVDLHTHLREPGFEGKETIASGARAAARGGFTTICCMPNTNPVIDSRTTLDYVLARAKGAPAHVRPIAAISKGEDGHELSEMAELVEAGAVAFSDDGRPVHSSRLMRLALEYAAPLGVPVVEHCQDEDLVGSGVMNEGAVATMLGLRGWPAVGEEVMLARDLALVRLTGARYHAAHLSTAGSVDLIRAAKADGLPVTAEVTPHHLLLTDSWVAGERTGPLAAALAAEGITLEPGIRYDTNTKVNPPLRTAADCEALLAGLLDGTIDAIATDHAPHTQVDKDCEYGEAAFGISGLETALASLLTLAPTGKLPFETLIAALTSRPSRAWRLNAGTLEPGAAADIAIFDPDEAWTIDPERFASRGHNTPLAGLPLRGRVRMTLLDGVVVYDAADEAGKTAGTGEAVR